MSPSKSMMLLDLKIFSSSQHQRSKQIMKTFAESMSKINVLGVCQVLTWLKRLDLEILLVPSIT